MSKFALKVDALYLYLGYLIVQLYSLISVFSRNELAISAIVFSITVFVIWSFIPMIGYIFARMISGSETLDKRFLLALGFSLGLMENALFYFDILTKENTWVGTSFVFFSFLIIAILPNMIKKT